MKNSINEISIKNKSKIHDLWKKQIGKIKHGCFKCPLCRESFIGIRALGAHLKDHCT